MAEIQKFTAECDVQGGGSTQVSLYIGNPKEGNHPFENQNRWLGSRGIQIPGYIMDSFLEISKLAEKNNVEVTELSKYVIEEVESIKKMNQDIAKATEISQSNNSNNDFANKDITNNQLESANNQQLNNLNSAESKDVAIKNTNLESGKNSLFEKTRKS